MRRNVRSVPVLLVLVALATTAVPSSAAAAAKISGRVAGVNGRAAALGLHPTIRLLRLTKAYEGRTIELPKAGGAFSAKVPAGIWAVVTSTNRGGRPVTSVRLYRATTRRAVPLGSARKVRVAARAAPRPGAGVPRVSVAPITVAGVGDISDLLISDIGQVAADGPCKVHVVEDRSSRGFAAIMAEVRLRASRFIDPADRRSMAESMATLQAWKPTFRVTGALTANANDTVSGALRVVDLKTGKVIAERTLDNANLFSASEEFAAEVDAALCKFPPRLHLAIVSNDTLTVNPLTVVDSNWNGTFDFPLQALTKNGAIYHLTAREIGVWTADVTAEGCSGTLTWSGTADIGDGSVILHRRADGILTYFVSFAWLRSTPVDGTLTCPPPDGATPYQMGAEAPVVISERAAPKLPAQGSGPIGPRIYGGSPMQATWTLSAP